eukprot:6492647-Amphidinium_carterae.5
MDKEGHERLKFDRAYKRMTASCHCLMGKSLKNPILCLCISEAWKSNDTSHSNARLLCGLLLDL